MKTKESEEMYLETILLLQKKKSALHAIDIVEDLGYAKSSVSHALKLLKQRDFIDIDESDVITLTAIGREKAEMIYERHQVLTKLLIKIGVSKEVAEDNACRIEHVITTDLFEKIKEYIHED